MTDVQRLRDTADAFELAQAPHHVVLQMRAAADEIERLRAGGCARDQGTTQYCAEAARMATDNERLRAALGNIRHKRREMDMGDLSADEAVWEADVIARAALEEAPQGRISEAAAQPAPSGWRPIETAPKDGTEVLMVFVFEDGETLHRVVRWDGSEMWPWREEYTGYREGEAKGWMPLPPAPGKEEA